MKTVTLSNQKRNALKAILAEGVRALQISYSRAASQRIERKRPELPGERERIERALRVLELLIRLYRHRIDLDETTFKHPHFLEDKAHRDDLSIKLLARDAHRIEALAFLDELIE
jgi:hypothetical protein